MMDYAGRVTQADTYPKLLRLNAKEHGGEIALREKDFGLWRVFTWNDYQTRVHDFALGMIELGLGKGDVIVAVSKSGRAPELLRVLEIAMQQGATVIAITSSNTPLAKRARAMSDVAANSKGDLFVYTRTGHPTISIGTARPFAHGGSRLFQFDKTGKYIREIGHESYGFLVAQQVRVDPQDNVWVVDQMSSMVIKFDPQGRLSMLLGRKAEAINIPARPAAAAAGPVGWPAPWRAWA